MRPAVWAAIAAAMGVSGCVHLLQPQTWTSDPRTLDLVQREYLMKDLVRGLPEEVFRRWYTRTSSWTDARRPSIRGERTDGPVTVYEVGSDAGIAGEVVFRGGSLDHWARWRLMQESVSSAWMKEQVRPRAVEAADMSRIVALDPAADALRPEELPDRSTLCPLDTGDAVETLAPLLVDGRRGNRLDRWFPSARAGDRGRDVHTLAPGTRLEILHWDPAHGRRLRGADGTTYRVDLPLGIDSFAAILCPAGQCAVPGTGGVVAQDLEVAVPAEGSGNGIAVLPGQSRIPVWMVRRDPIAAGSHVRVRRWSPCGAETAEIETMGAGARILEVPVAPPGLFRPAPAAQNR